MDDADAKAQILAATFEMLNQMPYEKMSLEMIAKRAGVSEAPMLNLFGSKKELTREAIIWAAHDLWGS